MEVKINKEIRNYTESVVMGLTLRQLLFSVAAIVLAAIIYFGLHSYVSVDVLTWIVAIVVIPIAFLGFFKYNGMTAEKFLVAFFKDRFLEPQQMHVESVNLYKDLTADIVKEHERQGLLTEKRENVKKDPKGEKK